MTRSWEVEYSFKDMGWIVRINGQTVCDGDGTPSIYQIPDWVSSSEDYKDWRKQVCASIERMSGLPCDPEKV